MYFDETNNYFDDYKVKTDNYDIDIGNIVFNRNDNMYTYDEGFNKGNLFKNIYSKYKNHVYKLKVNTKKDELLYKVQMYTFVLKDILLYLDTHPNDKSMINEFNNVKEKLHEVKDKYEKEYGVLTSCSLNDKDFNYINNPWPWDKGE